MTTADFDDDPPLLQPLPADPGLRRDYVEPPSYRDPPPRPPARRPGFGFWLSVAWCLLYLVVSQLLAGAAFLIAAIVFLVVRDGSQVLNDGAALTEWLKGTPMLWAAVVTQFTGLALSYLLLRLWCGKSWKRKIALTRGPTATHAALILIGIPALMALSGAADVVTKHVPSSQEILEWFGIHVEMEGTMEAIGKMLKDAPWGLAIFAVAVSPGICEEAFCRGFLAQGLSGRYRTWAVVLIVSFLFGCLHLDPQQGVGAMLLGAAIHGAYVATRSLPVAMFVHFANNGLGVVHMNGRLYPVLSILEGTYERQPIWYGIASVAFFAAVAYALYQTRCRLAPAVEGLQGWQPDGVSGVELPPPNSGTVVTHNPLSPVSAALVAVGALGFGVMLVLA